MLVYCVTNKINRKKYIGMTARTLEERWSSHLSAARNGSPYRFHSAIRKYGEDAFDAEVLFYDLDIDSCRTIEEQTIQEYNTMIDGYNAKPGGCGGWIVPDDKYDSWLEKHRETSFLGNNSRWSGYSDEFILDECVKEFNQYEEIEEFSYVDVLERVRTKYKGIPKSFSKNRFPNHQNSFRIALSSKLGIPIKELDKLARTKSKKHIRRLAEANIGKYWYSNDELQISGKYKTHPGTGWYRGRRYGDKN
jgi:group I intron endonuclease